VSENASTTIPPTDGELELARLAKDAAAKKPPHVRDKEWYAHRIAAGQMVIIRSHFKSIYLIPMALLSVVLAVFSAHFGDGHPRQEVLGLIWVAAFAFYMNIFVFEWSRAWTFGALGFGAALGMVFYLLEWWGGIGNFFRDIGIKFNAPAYWFFAAFFGLCALISVIRTRMNYVVVESNEVQIYRNAMFGDRERISMLNPRVEVRVPDMLEYFHPFYSAGQIIIHAPNRSIVLDNVLQIRRIERATDRIGSSLSVRVSEN
jgi:hypothetical protein